MKLGQRSHDKSKRSYSLAAKFPDGLDSLHRTQKKHIYKVQVVDKLDPFLQK